MCVATDSRGTEVSSVASILRVIGNQLTYKRYPVFYIVYLVSVPTPNAVAVVNSLLGTFLCITNDGVGGATSPATSGLRMAWLSPMEGG